MILKYKLQSYKKEKNNLYMYFDSTYCIHIYNYNNELKEILKNEQFGIYKSDNSTYIGYLKETLPPIIASKNLLNDLNTQYENELKELNESIENGKITKESNNKVKSREELIENLKLKYERKLTYHT